MRILKKAIVKEDGRTLIYYHFPDSASDSQKLAFDGVPGEASATVADEICLPSAVILSSGKANV